LVGGLLAATESFTEYVKDTYQFSFKYNSIRIADKSKLDYQFQEKYGVSPEIMEEVHKLNSDLHLGSELDHPYYSLFLDRDTDGPPSIFCSAA